MTRRFLLTFCMVKLLILGTACAPPTTTDSETKADAVARRLLGPAIPYQDQSLSAAQKKAVTESLEATRALAWQIFAQLLAPQTIQVQRADGAQTPLSLPQIFTWYSPEDMQRLMHSSFTAADPALLAAGAELPADLYKRSEAQLPEELLQLPKPLQNKWRRYLDEHPDLSAGDLIGLAGFNRTLFSPALAEAVIRRYAELQDCFPQKKKPAADAPFHRCWRDPLPAASVMIKTAWLNTRSPFPSFATDPKSLAAAFAKDASSWPDHAQMIQAPDDKTIVHARNADQDYALAGLHIVTRDLDDWLWISAFWSADPDSDFGSDRPEAVQALDPPWNQYKICAVSTHAQDPRSLESLEQHNPELAAAYRAVLGGRAGASWCSNPYIEQGPHNPRTNCIGCHQFAGTATQQEEILADAQRFPQQGSLKQRQDFPSDYIWSASQGPMGWSSLLQNLLINRRPRASLP